jgi:hypothetical protein
VHASSAAPLDHIHSQYSLPLHIVSHAFDKDTMHVALQALRLDGASARGLSSSQLQDIVCICPTLEQLALLGLCSISRKDLLEAIVQLPQLQVGALQA